MMNARIFFYLLFTSRRAMLLSLCFAALSPALCRAAELSSAQKRAALFTVKRIVIVPPFFGTSALLGPEPNAKSGRQPAAPPKMNEAQQRQQKRYLAYLQKLEAAADKRLPERAAARAPFEIVPADAAQTALQALNFTPVSLFQNNGRLRGTRFPLPDAAAVRKLAAQCQADAVLLDVMDEPRRNNGRVLFDPLVGVGLESPDVRCKAGFYLMLADGTEVLHAYVEALHPVTTGGRDVLLVDWTETQDIVIEDFMDELTRYTPPQIPQGKP